MHREGQDVVFEVRQGYLIRDKELGGYGICSLVSLDWPHLGSCKICMLCVGVVLVEEG